MMSQHTGCLETSGTVESFLAALQIWIHKPHVVNRRLCGTKIHTEEDVHGDLCATFLQQHIDSVKDCLLQSSVEPRELGAILSTLITSLAKCNKQTLCGDSNSFADNRCDTVVFVRDLLSKQLDKHPTVQELVVLDRSCTSALFVPFAVIQTNKDEPVTRCHELSYWIQYHEGENKSISLHVLGVNESSENSNYTVRARWFIDHLLPKILRWSQEQQSLSTAQSLRLVPIDRYNERYQLMKVKYAKELVKIWPEKTDPQKYVFEDVAIATYLLLLWENEDRRESSRKQSFVDLGCGNGLLVHILATEGHPGIGIDVRKRKIWDMYGADTVLQERSITPSDENLFPEYDWLIGNHSDELTPWIPVMAARSSMNTKFFVLPCCLHDFDSKFRLKLSGKSQYRVYLDFVKEVGETCGFTIEEDILRIPSTKRVCFIGRSRTYGSDDWTTVNSKMSTFISSRCKNQTTESTSDYANSSWADRFKPRESEEKVRNCTHVDKVVCDKIVYTVTNTLLTAEDAQVEILHDGRSWNCGGSLPLSEVATLFSGDILQELKKECGGLQTLLKNNHHIFQVSNGVVRLRDWSKEESGTVVKTHKKQKVQKDSVQFHKTRLCWFHENHPDKCPRNSVTCTFAHGSTELKILPKKVK